MICLYISVIEVYWNDNLELGMYILNLYLNQKYIFRERDKVIRQIFNFFDIKFKNNYK